MTRYQVNVTLFEDANDPLEAVEKYVKDVMMTGVDTYSARAVDTETGESFFVVNRTVLTREQWDQYVESLSDEDDDDDDEDDEGP